MRVVITGGTGLIGTALVQSLAADGHTVSILSRSPQKQSGRAPENVNFVYWDGRGLGEWVEHLDGADAVVNLAGESISGEAFLPDRWTPKRKQRILNSRLQVGETLVKAIAAVDKRPQVLVQASAVGYYGPTAQALITEASPPGEDFLASVCVAWENSTQPVEALGVRRPVARIGLVLSTEAGALPRLLLPSRLFVGGPFGSGNQYWPWIHLEDTVRALRFLIEDNTIEGPLNLTAPQPVTSKEFARALGRALNRPAVMPVPGFALSLLLGEVSTTVLQGQRALPQRLLDAGFAFTYPDIDAALNGLLNGSPAAHHAAVA